MKSDSMERSERVKDTSIYKALEAMIGLEVTNLNELIGKRKNAKTLPAQRLYDKKIIKTRDKTLRLMFEFNKITGGKIDEVVKELEEDKEEKE